MDEFLFKEDMVPQGEWQLVQILAVSDVPILHFNSRKNILPVLLYILSYHSHLGFVVVSSSVKLVPQPETKYYHTNRAPDKREAWFFMRILCPAEDSLQISSLIFSGKQWKNIYECRAVMIGALRSCLLFVFTPLLLSTLHFPFYCPL